ncbi:MAG: hypothetical protein WD009_07060, partial [Phycisphaeraceae bacterium]
MEENHTRQALDELADLFLTGPAAAPVQQQEAPDTDANADPAPRSATAATATGAMAGGGAAADLLDGPEPIRLAPKLPPAAPAARRDRRAPSRPELRLHRDEPGDDAP